VQWYQVQMRLDCIRKGVPYCREAVSKSGELSGNLKFDNQAMAISSEVLDDLLGNVHRLGGFPSVGCNTPLAPDNLFTS